MGEIADGVIVGSRLVRAIADAPGLAQGIDDSRQFLDAARQALTR